MLSLIYISGPIKSGQDIFTWKTWNQSERSSTGETAFDYLPRMKLWVEKIHIMSCNWLQLFWLCLKSVPPILCRVFSFCLPEPLAMWLYPSLVLRGWLAQAGLTDPLPLPYGWVWPLKRSEYRRWVRMICLCPCSVPSRFPQVSCISFLEDIVSLGIM